tara:strand:+ start:1276 stop:1452 length:177 start_codon:yes stop_codon:yes gene_type:complete
MTSAEFFQEWYRSGGVVQPKFNPGVESQAAALRITLAPSERASVKTISNPGQQANDKT